VNTSFDKEFENTDVIKFYPYIGDQYTNSSPRILILGESHYFSEDKKGNEEEINKWNNCKDTTREWIEELLKGDGYKPYKNTIRMLTNTDNNNEWIIDRLAFYNYFQKHVGFGHRDKSILKNNFQEFSEQAQEAYFKIIEILHPDLIIAWGVRDLYNYIPKNDRIFDNKEDEDKKLYRYKKYMDTYIWHMRHPSWMFFSLSKTIDEFSEVCKRLKIDYPIKQVVSG